MPIRLWFLFIFAVYVSGTCFWEPPVTLICQNEFAFSSIYEHAEILYLVNSFIAAKRLRAHFPQVIVIIVQGSMQRQQCIELKDFGITIIGCERGGYCTLITVRIVCAHWLQVIAKNR